MSLAAKRVVTRHTTSACRLAAIISRKVVGRRLSIKTRHTLRRGIDIHIDEYSAYRINYQHRLVIRHGWVDELQRIIL